MGYERGWAPYPASNAVSAEAAKSGTSTAKDGDPYGKVWVPLECCTVLRDGWFWNTTNVKALRELTEPKEIYYYGNYLLPLMVRVSLLSIYFRISRAIRATDTPTSSKEARWIGA